jgi:hypothetical protein
MAGNSGPSLRNKLGYKQGQAAFVHQSLGFVDIKRCAANDTWSGLKRVIRMELR